MTETMIERVARAIDDADHGMFTKPEILARAAIAAMREPTDAIIEAGKQITDTYYSEIGDFSEGWNAAIDAALQEKTE